jgi:mRNA-degrading endonuclease YafQ of YafQ-DinJ toxin-antitoxin module
MKRNYNLRVKKQLFCRRGIIIRILLYISYNATVPHRCCQHKLTLLHIRKFQRYLENTIFYRGGFRNIKQTAKPKFVLRKRVIFIFFSFFFEKVVKKLHLNDAVRSQNNFFPHFLQSAFRGKNDCHSKNDFFTQK